MKTKTIPAWITLVSLSSTLAFKKGDQIELQAFVNARTSANFTKSSKNISATLNKGTTGEVLETRPLPSGNIALKMKVESGPHAGESYWVYHNLKNSIISLYNKKNEEMTGPDLSAAQKARLKESITAIRAPEESAIIVAAETAVTILDKKNVADIEVKVQIPDCKTTTLLEKVPESQYDETQVVEPYREVAESPFSSHWCREAKGGWDVCRNEKGVVGFTLVNHGPNKIVKSNESHINREMNFEFEDRARSEMRLIVAEAPDDRVSHITYSIMMFFPRTVLPSIKKVGEELEVTLPTKEIIRYDAKTKEIIGGVMTEGAMRQDPNKRAVPAALNYTGSGVLIRSDKSGDLPYGDIETKSGAHAPSISIATVSKKGFKDCKIPSKDIWYTDYNNGGNVLIKKELATDAGLDSFIKSKCGFSIY